MEINSEVVHTPPRHAATVIMLRDTAHGLEVFLVKRHGLSDVLGGAYVFPGGKLDASDAELDPLVYLDQAPLDLHAALGESETDPRTATALYVAALREAFEESSILFTQDARLARLAQSGGSSRPFNTMLSDLSLRLQTSAMVPWSRWITPRMPSVTSKRFDTRFFVAAVPAGQEASHDNFETTESQWLQPRAALEQYWNGHIELAPPQIMSLAHLARHTTVHSVLSAARTGTPPLIMPEPFDEAGERVICYPGDPRHTVTARAMPGPTRLHYRNRRFEPLGGFEALFA
jgi:8-oxo-dGTP pyrophosphatase MutT (NUDIX family)